MRLPLLLPLLALPAFGIPATTTLTLDGNGAVPNSTLNYNELAITVDPDVFINLSDTQITTLSGTVTATFDIDPANHTTAELTLSNGRADATPVTFSNSFFSLGYNVTATGLSAAVFTIDPPGFLTNEATGEFLASEHAFQIDQGTISGTALGNPVNIVLSPQDPFEGAGSETIAGTVTLIPTAPTPPYLNYDVVVTLPITTSDMFDASGTNVDVTSNGTLRAEGTLQVPESEYFAWTITEGIPGADPDADFNGDGVTNAFAWAYGLGKFDDASAWRPMALPTGGYEIPLPPFGTIAPIKVRVSTALDNWNDLPANRLSGAQNPLPLGSSGTFTVTPSGDPAEFLILEVDE